MARRIPASQRADAQKSPFLDTPARPATAKPTRGNELFTLVAVIGATFVLSSVILWEMDIFGGGKWANVGDSRVHMLQGDPNVFLDFIKTKPDNKVAFVFYTRTCPHCKRMRAPFLEASAAFPDVTFVAIDASRSAELANQYKVSSVPAVVFMPVVRRTDRVTWYKGDPKLEPLKKYIEKQIHDSDIVIKAGLI